MPNQNIIGTTNCVRCKTLVNLKRDKRNKAYYFCTGEISENECGKRDWEGPQLSSRIISVAAKHGGQPHFTKYELVNGEPVVEIEQKIEQETEIDQEDEPEAEPEAREPETAPTRDIARDSATSRDEWPYV